jgi:hypothetical protein
MSGQANYEADPQAPVQESLVVHRPPHLRQVLTDPVQGCLTVPLPQTKQIVSSSGAPRR